MHEDGVQPRRQESAKAGHADIPGDMPLQVGRANAQIAKRGRNRPAGMVAQKHQRRGTGQIFDNGGLRIACDKPAAGRIRQIIPTLAQCRSFRSAT